MKFLCCLSLTAAALLLPADVYASSSDVLSDSAATGNKVQSISEVVVTGTRKASDVRHLPMTVSVVGREAIEESADPSLLPLLSEQVPGLFVTSRGVMGYGVSGGAAGGMSIRGIGGAPQAGIPTTGVMVLIDGHPQYMGLMGHPIADACQSMMAERVEVVRGPASVLYGSNAMGGVINIVTRKMDADGVSTSVNAGGGSYGSVQTEVSNRIRSGRFSSVVMGSYNRSDGHRRNMGFEQYGGYVKLGYDFARHWKASADVNLTHFNASNPGKVSAPLTDNDQRITRGMASLLVENNYGRTSGAVSVFYNWGKHWINDGYNAREEPLDYRFNSRDNMFGVSVYQSAGLFTGNHITLGFDYFRFGGKSWNHYTDGHDETQVDKTEEEFAGYIDFRQDLTSWMTVDAGVRADHHSHVGTEWIPQAGMSFRLPENISLKFMASKGFRYPTIREMYMFMPANPDLKPESVWNYEVSFAQSLIGGRLNYGVNVFYMDGENIIIRKPVNGRPMNVNTGHIYNTGAEAQVAYRISRHWGVDANYSYLHMENPVLGSPEHKLYAGASYTADRWKVYTGVQYVGGLYTDLAIDAGSDKREDFVLWNAGGEYRLFDWMKIWARCENILAQNYEINSGFPMPGATFMGGIRFDF